MKISTEALLTELQRLADEMGREPKVIDMECEGAYAYTTYRDRFGSWDKALDAAGINRRGSDFPVSDDDLLQELRRLADEHGAPPTLDDIRNHSGIPSTVYDERFPSFDTAVKTAGYDPEAEKSTNRGSDPRYTTDELAKKLHTLADELGHTPTTGDVREHLPHSSKTFRTYFDVESWDEVLETAGLDPADKPTQRDRVGIPTDELLAELDRLAAEYSDPPTLQELKEHSQYSMTTYTERFGSWQDALEAAGYEPRPATTAIPRAQLVEELQRLADELNRVPTTKDMVEHGKHDEKTYRRRFGSWGAALEAVGFADEPGEEMSTDSGEVESTS